MKPKNGAYRQINQLIAGTEFEGKSVEEIMLSAPAGAIYNNAAQIWNHTFYWNSMAPNAGGAPRGAVADLINSSFGNFDEFKVCPYGCGHHIYSCPLG